MHNLQWCSPSLRATCNGVIRVDAQLTKVFPANKTCNANLQWVYQVYAHLTVGSLGLLVNLQWVEFMRNLQCVRAYAQLAMGSRNVLLLSGKERSVTL